MAYLPPSVIVQGERGLQGTTGFVIPSTVCIVGRMDNYPSRTTSRVLANGTTVVIDAPNVLPDTIKLTAYDGTVLKKGTDYDQSVDADKGTFSVTIKKEGMKTQSVLIAYDYLPERFFEPCKWFTKSSVADFYGPAFDEDDLVSCPLSAAAKYAFDNGATSVCVVPVIDGKGSSGPSAPKNPKQTLDEALEKLKIQQDIAIVVPVNLDAEELVLVREHIDWCNANAMERRGIFGVDGTATDYSVDDLLAVQRSLDSDAVMFTPNTIAPVYSTKSRTAVMLPGWLYAAAMAGVAIALPLYRSLTRQQLLGFYGVQGWLVEERNVLAQGGGCVIEMSNGTIRVRHSLTTLQSRLLDWSYRGVYNYMVMSMRQLFDPYIGQPSGNVVIAQINASADAFLSRQVESGMIYNYSDLEVARRAGAPNTVDVSFRYAWLAPLDYIYVNFTVDMEY